VKSPIKRKSQRGTTLVETLVALVVLSVGLLGIAALQMTSLRNNRGAHLRSQAQVLAYDITDRMRANRNAALANAYVIALAAPATGSGIVLTDLQEWKATLASALPLGDGEVTRDGDMFRIRIRWTDTLGVQTFDTRTRI
jgi:type IV pilus assembly protein PilV